MTRSHPIDLGGLPLLRGRLRSASLIALVTWGAAVPTGAIAQTDTEAVLQVVQMLFDGMEHRDRSLLDAALHPEAQLVTVPDDGGGDAARVTKGSDFIAGIVADGPALLERMWEPEVRIDGPIATAWAPYDFHRGGEFSHCGIDAVQLVRGDAGWRILSVIYTLHGEALCEPSPLGPPTSDPLEAVGVKETLHR